MSAPIFSILNYYLRWTFLFKLFGCAIGNSFKTEEINWNWNEAISETKKMAFYTVFFSFDTWLNENNTWALTKFPREWKYLSFCYAFVPTKICMIIMGILCFEQRYSVGRVDGSDKRQHLVSRDAWGEGDWDLDPPSVECASSCAGQNKSGGEG